MCSKIPCGNFSRFITCQLRVAYTKYPRTNHEALQGVVTMSKTSAVLLSGFAAILVSVYCRWSKEHHLLKCSWCAFRFALWVWYRIVLTRHQGFPSYVAVSRPGSVSVRSSPSRPFKKNPRVPANQQPSFFRGHGSVVDIKKVCCFCAFYLVGIRVGKFPSLLAFHSGLVRTRSGSSQMTAKTLTWSSRV